MTKLNTTELQQRSMCQVEALNKLSPENQLWTLIHRLWIGKYFIEKFQSVYWAREDAQEWADKMNAGEVENGDAPDWLTVTLSDAIKMCAESL